MATGPLRRLAELSLGPLVVKRRLPRQSGGGAIVVSGRVGGLKFLLRPARLWDPELLEIAARIVRPGDTVWDVGTNVGLFSKAAAFHAGRGGRIISIEADLDAVALLNRTSRLHAADHAEMTVLPVAVGEVVGFVRFCIAARARAANFVEGFGSTQTGGVKEVRTLPCVSLDSLTAHFPLPDVVKIDVEGAELGVFNGAREVLAKARPIIYSEVSEDARVEVARLLVANGYRLWDGARFRHGDFTEVSLAAYNTVAIPVEKVPRYLDARGA
jgi:FkbM family methyltransferase